MNVSYIQWGCAHFRGAFGAVAKKCCVYRGVLISGGPDYRGPWLHCTCIMYIRHCVFLSISDAPGAVEVSVGAVLSRSAMLSWTEAQSLLQVTYIVEFIRLDTGDSDNCSTTDLQIELSPLQPNRDYSVSVTPMSRAGEGPTSASVDVITLEDGVCVCVCVLVYRSTYTELKFSPLGASTITIVHGFDATSLPTYNSSPEGATELKFAPLGSSQDALYDGIFFAGVKFFGIWPKTMDYSPWF